MALLRLFICMVKQGNTRVIITLTPKDQINLVSLQELTGLSATSVYRLALTYYADFMKRSKVE